MSWKRLLKSWGSFCGLIQFCWLQCNYHSVKSISPFYFTNFSWHSLESPESNQKYFTPISSSRHTEFAVAFPCKFDPVWSNLIQFDPVSISSSEQLNYHRCNFVQCCFDLTIQAVLTHKIIHIFTIQMFRFLAPLEISPTSQPPPWNSFISCEFIDVSGTTYYGSYFTNNLALISSTNTYITFLIIQF